MEKWTLGILTLLISLTISLNSVFAKSGGGGRPVPVPEPVSCLLFLAGGATLVTLRRLRSKKNSKVFNEHSQDANVQ
ncbi:MAG: PEP-CTERM sorting domain-containing protein [Candidatus Brocadia sp.]|uniref:PEP-CTERM sorting domain-containing protein n=1 Tax=Candidatus Brocadia sinica JPN1 TaxID=1197129 RepID=A0ABQ0K358_9BACT|nr:PEP-CTERM sorting domain-containing protein [Candidatus Brocadia sinica]KAA0240938.1 MAG: PEP-CTERM sorting domain-containing protein [Candidatus Brocadia sp. AMX2]MBL1170779.1 PEP-CTERM sorting domain-containing protein [Candidatus Brocadia sp. AMX1]MCQ3919006.1 PEP-CTERM sorting domain-containing protein [Candidatus Brocadia sp.]NOG43102.1 PEP-CTERM sorting domain-containing protein [Planctomycetota bacterium]KXK31251.1 MAG: hypothetical protein UZ01_00964 [Candidatus Brocadia sinica]